MKMTCIKDLRSSLSQYGQEHILRFWETLSDSEKEELFADIDEINFEAIISDFQKAKSELQNKKKLDVTIKPIPSSLFGGINKSSEDTLKNYETLGYNLISEGKVAVLVLAGGQGTRLGVTYPKGMYDVGLPSGKTLFQIQAERILKLTKLANERTNKTGSITWFVMTSESTIKPTEYFFKMNNYFGLNKENVVMFEQFMLPSFSFDGKIIMESKYKIAVSPDGNGGLYKALRDRKILSEMERRGIDYIHAFSIDNILIKVGDPVFIGYCFEQKADCGAKVIEKIVPEEAIGVICKVNDKWRVVEYSELPQKTAVKREDDGSLVFKAGNICNHLFTTKFLRKIAENYVTKLELHVSKKKIPTIDKEGNVIKPKEPNGIKIEKFIFDVFPFSEKFVVWQVNREEEFSALKNPDDIGKDCPSTAKSDLFNLHKKWIINAGGTFDTKNIICEISPLLSYAGENLEKIVSGKTFSSPLLLKSEYE